MKPILFNTDMVRAILAGRKTVTRRVVKPQYREGEAGFYVVTDKYTGEYRYIETYDEDERGTDRRINPPYKPGDILWVRETWATTPNGQDYLYRADADGNAVKDRSGVWHVPKWRPSIHMTKEAARIFLRVTAVRVERLQEIDGAGIKAEGTAGRFGATRGAFMNLWNSTIPKHPNKFKSYPYRWEDNPWVWVIEFERCERPGEGTP